MVELVVIISHRIVTYAEVENEIRDSNDVVSPLVYCFN